MDELGNHVSDLLKQLDSLWIYNGNNTTDILSQLSKDIIDPINKQIQQANELKENLLKQINNYKEKAIIQTYSLVIPLSICQPSDSLNLQEQLDDWKILVESFNDKIKDRTNEINELNNTLNNYCNELDSKIEDKYPNIIKKIEINHNSSILYLDDLSMDRIERYKIYINEIVIEINKLKNNINNLKKDIKELWDELSFSDDKRTKHPVDRFVITDKYYYYSDKKQIKYSLQQTNDILEKRKQELLLLYQRLYGAVKDLLPKICKLWRELKIPSNDSHRIQLWKILLKKIPTIEEQKQFLLSLKDPLSKQKFPINIIEACEAEYERLENIKREIMKNIILKERKKLNHYWDKLHFSEEQKLSFEPGHNDIYTQETLNLIRTEIKRLHELLQSMSTLLKQVERREWIKSEMKRFEQTASDPNRFKGSSTRLLEEEKFRKVVAKEFPRLTNSLRKTLVLWEKNHGGQAFYYDGEPYIDTMNKEEDNPNFDLLHLRLLTSKPTKLTPDIQGPSIKSVSERKTKPLQHSQPRPPRPKIISPDKNIKSQTVKKPKTTTISNRKQISNTSTPLKSTKPRTSK